MLFGKPVLDIAYSTIGLLPINTKEHFLCAAQHGFPALKCDVRITADNVLILCHDPAFTIGESGLITRYDKTNARTILEMTADECLSLRYEAGFAELGYHPAVATLDDFVRICQEQDVIAYITVRGDRIAFLTAEVFRILKKYGMEDRAMINSFEYESLAEVRKYSADMPLSHVYHRGHLLCEEELDRDHALGNAVSTVFFYPGENGDALTEASRPMLAYAKTIGHEIHLARVTTLAQRQWMIDMGFTGFQVLNPIEGLFERKNP